MNERWRGWPAASAGWFRALRTFPYWRPNVAIPAQVRSSTPIGAEDTSANDNDRDPQQGVDPAAAPQRPHPREEQGEDGGKEHPWSEQIPPWPRRPRLVDRRLQHPRERESERPGDDADVEAGDDPDEPVADRRLLEVLRRAGAKRERVLHACPQRRLGPGDSAQGGIRASPGPRRTSWPPRAGRARSRRATRAIGASTSTCGPRRRPRTARRTRSSSRSPAAARTGAPRCG